MQEALSRRWKNLAEKRIKDVRPTIPRGDKFWEVSKSKRKAIEKLIASEDVRSLVTPLKDRKDKSEIELLDVAYWVKGCSSLGRLRYAILIRVDHKKQKHDDICFLDIKEAVTAAVPRSKEAPTRATTQSVSSKARVISRPILARRRGSSTAPLWYAS